MHIAWSSMPGHTGLPKTSLFSQTKQGMGTYGLFYNDCGRPWFNSEVDVLELAVAVDPRHPHI